MRTTRSLCSLTPRQLLTETRTLLAARAEHSAQILEHVAEIDARRLHVEAAYRSTQAYCVGELGMTTDAAEKWVQAARVVRRVPVLLDAVAGRRLHVSAVVLLAPHVERENSEEWITLAAGRTCSELREVIATRLRTSTVCAPIAPQVVANMDAMVDSNPPLSQSCEVEVPVGDLLAAPAQVVAMPAPPPTRTLAFTVPAELAEAYREALALAPYEVAHDPSQAFAHMLAAWREKLEKRRFGSASAAARPRRASADSRHVPAHVRRQVWQRDGGRCTFVGDTGRRCECREHLEFDHVIPRARGGRSTVDNLRLRCRAHNQLAAERAFGRGFMDEKRADAHAAREAARIERERQRDEHAARRAEEATRRAAADEVAPYLRRLGLGAADARAVAMRTCGSPGTPLDQRVLAAIRTLGPRGTTRIAAPTEARAGAGVSP